MRPTRIDPESGLRFYSTEQLPRLNRILALKESGLTPDQISRLLEDDLPLEERRQMLTVKQGRFA
ncbi:MAG: MerR family transcriptional regulator [Nitrospirae bacterium]|nr:MerR family transcriptional regulator [Nitrospirota bacterium]